MWGIVSRCFMQNKYNNHSSPLRKGGLLLSMYMCQTISLGYVFGSLPVIMRQQGMSLKAIGTIFILHLPWALKFLWAGFVDQKYIEAFGRRKTWILPLQWFSVVLLMALSQFPPQENFAAMYALVLLLHTAMATNDIAVDGYATDLLLPSERAWGNTIQSGARFAGLMLGGGFMLYLHASLGWEILCYILAAAVFALSLPVFFHKEVSFEHVDEQAGSSGGVIAFIKRREVLIMIPLLILSTTFIFSAVQMRTPFLVDMGINSSEIGKLLMGWAYPVGLLGTVISGYFLKRTGSRNFVILFSIIALALNLFSVMAAYSGSISKVGAVIMLTGDNILIGGVHVWAYTNMMKVSYGKNSGTGFAVLSSMFIIVPLSTAPFFGYLGDSLGFTKLYFVILTLIMAGAFTSLFLFRFGKREAEGKINIELNEST